jgi:hypothetical protein
VLGRRHVPRIRTNRWLYSGRDGICHHRDDPATLRALEQRSMVAGRERLCFGRKRHWPWREQLDQRSVSLSFPAGDPRHYSTAHVLPGGATCGGARFWQRLPHRQLRGHSLLAIAQQPNLRQLPRGRLRGGVFAEWVTRPSSSGTLQPAGSLQLSGARGRGEEPRFGSGLFWPPAYHRLR